MPHGKSTFEFHPESLGHRFNPNHAPPVRVFRNLDPTFARPAPPTADRGISGAQLKKHNRQQLLKARNIRRSRST